MSIISLHKNHEPDIHWIYTNAFPKEEAVTVAGLMIDLVSEQTIPATLALGYQIGDTVVAAAGFSPVYFDQPSDISAYILSPLAVHADYQGRGIATQLIEHAKQTLRALGVDVLIVYGDPEYYARYGFDADVGRQFIPPYPIDYPFGWQAMRLSDRPIGNTPRSFTCVSALSHAVYW